MFDRVLADIDRRQPPSASEDNRRQAMQVLLLAGVCLLLIHYLKFASVFHVLLGELSVLAGESPRWLYRELQAAGYLELAGEAWWGLWHVIGYVLIPWWYLSRRGLSMRDNGCALNDTFAHWRWYLLLLVPVSSFAVMASFRPDFASHYPFYAQAGRSVSDLVAWEIIYIGQFICLEFFFRGFLLHTLRPAFGVNAVFIMCLPYLMIHFPKPWLEASGALLFGLFLGLLALRSRSIWGGVAVHAGVALTMDMSALWQSAALPTQWWP